MEATQEFFPTLESGTQQSEAPLEEGQRPAARTNNFLYLERSFQDINGLDADSLGLMLQIAKVILTMQTVSMSPTGVRNRCAHLISTLSKQKPDDCVSNPVILMNLLGLAHVSVASNTTAEKQLFLFMREFRNEYFHELPKVLSALACEVMA